MTIVDSQGDIDDYCKFLEGSTTYKLQNILPR